MSYRIEKINNLIAKHISTIITREVDLKSGVFVTITKVDTTSDLRYARVFVSIFPEKETNYAIKTLQKEIFSIQKELNKKLTAKILPKVEFRLDSTEVKARELEDLLEKIREA